MLKLLFLISYIVFLIFFMLKHKLVVLSFGIEAKVTEIVLIDF